MSVQLATIDTISIFISEIYSFPVEIFCVLYNPFLGHTFLELAEHVRPEFNIPAAPGLSKGFFFIDKYLVLKHLLDLSLLN